MKSTKNLKPHVKAGISFGASMAVCFIASKFLFPSYSDGQRHAVRAVVSGLLEGIFSGLLYGWLTLKLSNSKFADKATKFEVVEGE